MPASSATRRIGVVMNGVTGRMGSNQHLLRSILPIRDGLLEVGAGLRLPIRPMIGVIGTAPAGGQTIPTGTPGEHGGNMDCKEITAGTSVFLPVAVDGALLALGDIHALMGDGEVCICAAEVSGTVTLATALLRERLPTPALRSERELAFLASAKTLDECERLVLGKAHAFLAGSLGLSANDAARFMSLVGDLAVCQVVDPLKTMRFSLPLAVLRHLNAGACRRLGIA